MPNKKKAGSAGFPHLIDATRHDIAEAERQGRVAGKGGKSFGKGRRIPAWAPPWHQPWDYPSMHPSTAPPHYYGGKGFGKGTKDILAEAAAAAGPPQYSSSENEMLDTWAIRKAKRERKRESKRARRETAKAADDSKEPIPPVSAMDAAISNMSRCDNKNCLTFCSLQMQECWKCGKQLKPAVAEAEHKQPEGVWAAPAVPTGPTITSTKKALEALVAIGYEPANPAIVDLTEKLRVLKERKVQVPPTPIIKEQPAPSLVEQAKQCADSIDKAMYNVAVAARQQSKLHEEMHKASASANLAYKKLLKQERLLAKYKDELIEHEGQLALLGPEHVRNSNHIHNLPDYIKQLPDSVATLHAVQIEEFVKIQTILSAAVKADRRAKDSAFEAQEAKALASERRVPHSTDGHDDIDSERDDDDNDGGYREHDEQRWRSFSLRRTSMEVDDEDNIDSFLTQSQEIIDGIFSNPNALTSNRSNLVRDIIRSCGEHKRAKMLPERSGL